MRASQKSIFLHSRLFGRRENGYAGATTDLLKSKTDLQVRVHHVLFYSKS